MKQDKSNIVDKGWVKMLPTLEKELPQKNKNRILWFWFLGILLVGSMAYSAWPTSKSDMPVPELQQFAAQQQSEKAVPNVEGVSAESKSRIAESRINKHTPSDYESNQKVIISNESISSNSRTTKSNQPLDVNPELQLASPNLQNFVEQNLQQKTSIKITAATEEPHKTGAPSESISSKLTASEKHVPVIIELAALELLPLTQSAGLFSEPKIPGSALVSKVVLPQNNGIWRLSTGLAFMQGISQNQSGLQVHGGLSRKWHQWQIGVRTSFGLSNSPSASDNDVISESESAIGLEPQDEFDVICSNSLNSEPNFIPLACAGFSIDNVQNSNQGGVNLFGSIGIEMGYKFSPLFSLSAVSGMEFGSAINNVDMRSSERINMGSTNNLFGQLDANISISNQLSLFAGYRLRFKRDVNTAITRERGLLGIKYII